MAERSLRQGDLDDMRQLFQQAQALLSPKRWTAGLDYGPCDPVDTPGSPDCEQVRALFWVAARAVYTKALLRLHSSIQRWLYRHRTCLVIIGEVERD